MNILHRGPARGVLATALAGWSIATLPMIASLNGLTSDGERSTQLFAVILVGVVAIPISLLIAAAFLPAHLGLQRRGLVKPWWYILWGMVLIGAAAVYILVVNPDAVSGPRDLQVMAAAVAGGGAALGSVFWLFAVRLP